MAEELHDVKLQVGLLQQEVEVRGRQIDALLTKLDSTADRIVELTVEIRSLNSRQERQLYNSICCRVQFGKKSINLPSPNLNLLLQQADLELDIM
jgi:hypothetical protein